MFIGHFGVALAAKKVAPRTSLGTLVLAAQLVDLIWPVLLFLGVERVIVAPGTTAVCPLDFISYPLSHSLLADVGWACLFAGLYFLFRRDFRGAACLGCVVLSHWFLDALSHRPDLPLYPGSSTLAGLGLWNSRAGTIVVETTILLIGVLLYQNATRAHDRIGFYSFRTFLAILWLIYLLDLFGPPPPSETAVAYAGLAMWAFVAWAYWLDRHRAPKFAARILSDKMS